MPQPSKTAVLLVAVLFGLTLVCKVQAQISVDSSAVLSVSASADVGIPQPIPPGFIDLSQLPNTGGGGSGEGRNRQGTARSPHPTALSTRALPVAKPTTATQAEHRNSGHPSAVFWRPVADAPTSDATSFGSQTGRSRPDSLGEAGSFGGGSFGSASSSVSSPDIGAAISTTPAQTSRQKSVSGAIAVPTDSGTSGQDDTGGAGPRSRRQTTPSAGRGSSTAGSTSPPSS